MFIDHIIPDHFLEGLLADVGSDNCDILAGCEAAAAEHLLSDRILLPGLSQNLTIV